MNIVRREYWSAAPYRGQTKPLGSVTAIVVHHTGADTAPGARGMRDTQRYHQAEKKWPDIGYHYAISEGKVYEGRAPHTDGSLALGTHVARGNTGRIGVVIFGDYSTVQPDTRDIAALVDLCHHLCRMHLLSADAITGHRDHTSSTCPGDALYAILPSVRRRVSWIEPVPVLPPDPVPTAAVRPPHVARNAPAMPSPSPGTRKRRGILEAALGVINSVTKQKVISMETKQKRESKTWWGVLALVVGAVGWLLGVEIETGFITDGFQAEDLRHYFEAMYVVGAALGLWGIRTAEKKIR